MRSALFQFFLARPPRTRLGVGLPSASNEYSARSNILDRYASTTSASARPSIHFSLEKNMVGEICFIALLASRWRQDSARRFLPAPSPWWSDHSVCGSPPAACAWASSLRLLRGGLGELPADGRQAGAHAEAHQLGGRHLHLAGPGPPRRL